jgi:hypothetical protein
MVARYRASNMTTPERKKCVDECHDHDVDDPLNGGTTYVPPRRALLNLTTGVAEKSVALPVIADAPAPIFRGMQRPVYLAHLC